METTSEQNKQSQAFWNMRAPIYTKLLSKGNFPIMATLSNLSKISLSKTILEVGCGASEGTKFLTLIAPKPSIIYSLDFSEAMLNLSLDNFKEFTDFNSNQENSFELIKNESQISISSDIEKHVKGTHVKFIQGDCEKLPFKDEQFDTYISCLCLHITNDYHNALREAYRVIKKGGYFSCAVWGKKEWTNFRIIEEVCLKYGLEVKYFKNYRMSEDKDLISFCEQIGFKNVRIGYSDLIRNVQDENEFYNNFFDMSLKKQIDEIKAKDPEKAKLIDDDIKKALHQFFSVDKKVPVMNIMYLFGQK